MRFARADYPARHRDPWAAPRQRERHSYKHGADVLVDGDPIANIKLIEDPAQNFLVIMKDVVIYKNLLDPAIALTGN